MIYHRALQVAKSIRAFCNPKREVVNWTNPEKQRLIHRMCHFILLVWVLRRVIRVLIAN